MERIFIIPPDGNGSKGDEAMVRGALELYSGIGEVTLLTPREQLWKEWIVDKNQQFDEHYVALEKMPDYIEEKCRLVIIGADLMDGLFDSPVIQQRLETAQKVISLGGSAEVISCSFRDHVNEEIIKKVVSIGENLQWYLRDKISLINFEKQTGLKGKFFPDLAFQYEPIIDERVKCYTEKILEQRNEGKKIVGVNLCEHSFRSFYKEDNIENKEEYIKKFVENLLSVYDNSYFVLISNDIRKWENHWSDMQYLLEIEKKFKDAGITNYLIIDEFCLENEILAILENIDIVISGRMHLIIASIRAGSFPIAYFGDSGSFRDITKMKGMFLNCLGRNDLVVTDNTSFCVISKLILDDYEQIKNRCDCYLKNYFLESQRMIEEFKKNNHFQEKKTINDSTIDQMFSLIKSFNKKDETIKGLLSKKNDDYWTILDNKKVISEKEKLILEKNEAITEKDIQIKKISQKLDELNVQIETLQQEVRNKEGHIELLLPAEREYKTILNSKMFKCMRVICHTYDIAMILPRFIGRNVFAFCRMMTHVNVRELKIASGYVKNEGFVGAYHHLMRDYHKSDLKTLQLEVEEKIYSEIKSTDECEHLTLPYYEKPLVSIVIPAYNQFTYTYYCLKSIIENSGDISYEVILADDCSTDLTTQIASIVDNLVIAKTQSNKLFLRNCNNAARYVKGEYILFLNNDTQVQKNWLQPLVQLCERDSSIGMVGSKLVYADGSLQEAGGIIWKDGTGWNYGRNDDAMKPEYNYVRDVDYISGAAIMIRHDLWKTIGGFDEYFAPAYCEDSDLAFMVRKAGYRVVYQPASVVVHFEGKSNGTDLNSGVKKYQVENSNKLKEKWKDEFAKQYDNSQCVFKARERSQNKKVILVIDHYVPQFDKDAGSKTTMQYLKMFVQQGYSVKFMGDNFYQDEPYTSILQQMGVEVLYGSWYAQHWKEWILENRNYIDFAYLNRPHITIKYIDFLKEKTNIKCIYYGHDLHFLRLQREYELSGDISKKQESEEWLEKELYIMRKADISYYPSYVEEEEIHKIDPSIKVKAITAYVYEQFKDDIQKDFALREGILFVGGFGHPPNEDAVLWFTKEVLPKIEEKISMPFYIVGSKATDAVKNLNGGNIIVKGFVSEEELTQLYNTCKMVVVPLRYGAGVKGKVVEALYYGTPMVTTSVGAEGIGGVEKIISIADDADSFANAVIETYNNDEKLATTVDAYQAFVKDYFSVNAVWKIIKDDFS